MVQSEYTISPKSVDVPLSEKVAIEKEPIWSLKFLGYTLLLGFWTNALVMLVWACLQHKINFLYTYTGYGVVSTGIVFLFILQQTLTYNHTIAQVMHFTSHEKTKIYGAYYGTHALLFLLYCTDLNLFLALAPIHFALLIGFWPLLPFLVTLYGQKK